MKIRDAAPNDLPVIVEIYNHAIVNSVATFDLDPFTVEQRKKWFKQFGKEHPFLVCEGDDGKVWGFAYYLPYRAKPGYRTTKETTIYVAPNHHRHGVGSALYEELIARARVAGVHALIAVLGGKNVPSEALHRKFGYELIGHYPEIGKKFDRWVDTYTFYKLLK